MKSLVKLIFLLWCLTTAPKVFAGTAYLQIIHDCADPGLDTVDVYLDTTLLDAGVTLNTAIGFFTLPSDTSTDILIANKHSTSYRDSIRSFHFNSFTNGQRYVLMLGGTYNPGFQPNPDGRDISLGLKQVTPVDSIAPDTSEVAIRFFQGATDLRAVNILIRSNGQLLATVAYGDSNPTVLLHHGNYEFQLISTDSTENFGTYKADFSAFGGQSVIVYTGGFRYPSYNNDGEFLSMFVASGTGAISLLPVEESAFQLLHNSADLALDSVDVYLNGQVLYAGLPFRNALPALTLYAYANYDIGIAQKNSVSVADTFWHETFDLKRDTFYIATMAGLLRPGNYAANPDGISTDFQVLLQTPAEYGSASNQNFDFFMVNGVTDAPALNLYIQDGPQLINGLEYADQSSYVSLPSSGAYSFQLKDTAGNAEGNYYADFTSYQGGSGVLLVSGFLNPANNGNGPAMDLYLAPLTGGSFIPLNAYTAIKNVNKSSQLRIFPNPAASSLSIQLGADYKEVATLKITDMAGREIMQQQVTGGLGSGLINLDVSNIEPGMYMLQLNIG
ncbi:MAG TPA: T9SS type A sorting domain-containing protein, partial [Chitinophagales bacterium]|nr:T9SS type A sorting domain-containing protein [Chitinophagales bacterium]